MTAQPTRVHAMAGFCILLLLTVSMAGCTGQSPQTTVPVTTPAQPAPADTAAPAPLSPATPEPAQTIAMAETPAQTTVTATPPPDPVSLTVNSVTRQTKVYTMTPKPGRVFLVLDITVKNNAVEKGFDLSDSSLSLSYAKPGAPTEASLTTQVRGGLNNPIIMPTTIEQNDKRTGQVVFGVADGSARYTLNLIGSNGAVAASAPVAV